MEYPCIACGAEVRPKQHAVQCDSCSQWQHRLCASGVSAAAYKLGKKAGFIRWTCAPCSTTEALTPSRSHPGKRQRKDEPRACQILHSTVVSSEVSTLACDESSIRLSAPALYSHPSPLHVPNLSTVIPSSSSPLSSLMLPVSPTRSRSLSQSSSVHSCTSLPNRSFTVDDRSPPSSSPLLCVSPSRSRSLSESSSELSCNSLPNRTFTVDARSPPSLSPLHASYLSPDSTRSPPSVSSLLQPSSPRSLSAPSPFPDLSYLPQTSAVSFQQPQLFTESNLEGTIAIPESSSLCVGDETEPRFKVIPKASKRGGDLLVEEGYTYVKDGTLSKWGQQRWRCSMRIGSSKCLGSVLQKGDTFCKGAQPHMCAASDCALSKAKIKAHLRAEGKARPYASGATLVKEAIQNYLPSSAPASSLPSVASLVRSTNRARQKCRPKHPNTLEFEWVEEALPADFKKADIRVGSARHVLFFTTFLLSLLRSAKTWYVDATFKAVHKPFYQLWSIHAFVRQNSSVKQVPTLLVIMSRRSKADYKAILEFIKSLLPGPPCAVVMDFEAAVWGAFREVFSSVQIRGCCFHWKQAVWRKIKELGLHAYYSRQSNSRRFLMELMSLPFLPAEQIIATFQEFCNVIQPSHDKGFHSLMEYLESTWIHCAIFPPSTWSVYGHAVRTNNDVEGWHNGLNRMVSRRGNENVNLNLYELVDVLHQVCVQVKSDCQLITEEKLRKHQRREFLSYQAKVFILWDKFANKELRPSQLLRQVSTLHNPFEGE